MDVSGGAKLFILSRKNHFGVLCNSLEIIEKSEGVPLDSRRPAPDNLKPNPYGSPFSSTTAARV